MKIKNISLIAMMVAVISICSWIAIPMAVPFTMQTFAVFVTLLVIGGKRGTAAFAIYILLGMVGIPVFSGFQAGVGHILGPTGGYIVGFVFMGIVYSLGESLPGRWKKVILLAAGLLVCYVTGTLWFMAVSGSGKGFWEIVGICVLPYVIPDVVKLVLAVYVSERIGKRLEK